MPLSQPGSGDLGPLQPSNRAFAGIRRSERLTRKAALFLDTNPYPLVSPRNSIRIRALQSPSGKAPTQTEAALDHSVGPIRSRQVAGRRCRSLLPTGTRVPTREDCEDLNESTFPMDFSQLDVNKSGAMVVGGDVSVDGDLSLMDPIPELKRRSVRMSIRKSLQPLANMLTNGRKKGRRVRRSSSAVEETSRKMGSVTELNEGEGAGPQLRSQAHQQPSDFAMNHKTQRNTICVSTGDLTSLNLLADSRPASLMLPPLRSKAPCRRQSSTFATNYANLDKVTQDRIGSCHDIRAATTASDERFSYPRPLPRTSLLRQENTPPLPPARRRSPRIIQDSAGGGLDELRRYEPNRVLRLAELSVNSPKRKMCLEPAKECAADDETSFLKLPGALKGSCEAAKKRRKTVRFQDNAVSLQKRTEPSSNKAKLQLCIYLNHGHLSVHVMRGANLPLLPDQHELNSYIKVALEPKDLRTQHRSQLVSGTVDPSYDFRLSFELPPNAEEERSLLITVWHRDYITKQSRLLGFLSFAVKKVVDAGRIEGWFRLPSLAITKKTHI